MRKIIFFTAVGLFSSIGAFSQNIGVGTSTPGARLEVKGSGSSSTTNTFILKNANGDTLLRMLDNGKMGLSYNANSLPRTLNIGGNGANFFRDELILGGAIFPTDTSLVMWSDDEANNYIILQPVWGNVGIGTYSPKTKLHVRNGSSGAAPATEAVSIFESSTDAAINLMTPNSKSSAIFFGNVTNPHHGSITYNPTFSLNGLAFRCNSATRAVLDAAGNLGIGDLTPGARLHVSNGSSGGTYHGAADLILEDNSNAYIQFSTPNNSASGLLAGNSDTDIYSAFLFLQDSSIDVRSGGNVTRLIIDNDGRFAMGDFTPAFRLHLNTDSAAKPTSGTWTVSSDSRLKKDVHAYTDGLDEIIRIQPVWFTYNGEAGMPTETGVGVLAQDLQQVAPYMVSTWDYKAENGNTNSYLSVNNGPMTYMLINAVKEQQSMITSQQIELDALQEKFASLEKEMQALKSLVLQKAAK